MELLLTSSGTARRRISPTGGQPYIVGSRLPKEREAEWQFEPGPDLLLAGPLFRKNVGALLYEYPSAAFTRHAVTIDILLRTRAAMHNTIAAAAVWQFEATQNRFLYSLIIISIFLACYHVPKNEKKIVLLWGPFLWGPCSAEHAEHA